MHFNKQMDGIKPRPLFMKPVISLAIIKKNGNQLSMTPKNFMVMILTQNKLGINHIYTVSNYCELSMHIISVL